MFTLAIDPSINSSGVAVARDQMIIAAARIAIPPDTSLDIAERCRRMATKISGWTGVYFKDYDLTIVHEWPQIYASDTPAKANAVITMAAVNLAVDAIYPMAELHSYVPADIWGQLPKIKTGSAWKSPRGARIKSRLTPEEFALVPDQHDVVDAVGILLHQLKRLGLRKVMSNV